MRVTSRTRDAVNKIQSAIAANRRVMAFSGTAWFPIKAFKVEVENGFSYWYAQPQRLHRDNNPTVWYNVNTLNIPS